MCVTRASHRSSPPFARSRATSASVSLPAPPSGTGKPTSWASAARIHPKIEPVRACVERSVCIVFPASSNGPPTPSNGRAAPCTVASDVRASQGRSRTPATRPTCSAARTGGNGDSSAPRIASPIRSHRRYSLRQRSPSPAANWSSEAAVPSMSPGATVTQPPGAGCASARGRAPIATRGPRGRGRAGSATRSRADRRSCTSRRRTPATPARCCAPHRQASTGPPARAPASRRRRAGWPRRARSGPAPITTASASVSTTPQGYGCAPLRP